MRRSLRGLAYSAHVFGLGSSEEKHIIEAMATFELKTLDFGRRSRVLTPDPSPALNNIPSSCLYRLLVSSRRLSSSPANHRGLQANIMSRGVPLRTNWLQGAMVSTAAELPVDSEGVMGPGSLVFFKRDTRTGVCLVTRPDGKRNWLAEDTRRNTISLKPLEVHFVCSSSTFTEQEIMRIEAEACEAVDCSLLKMAWEVVQEEKEMYTIPQMADFLFGSATPSNALAAYLMLSEDRTYFKQTGRQPATFQPRRPEDVGMLLAREAAKQKQEEELANLKRTLSEASAEPSEKKPSPESWLAGKWSEYVHAVEAVAMEQADARQQSLAFNILTAMGRHVAVQHAAQLLQDIGFWSPHEQLALRKAGLTPLFPPPLEELAAKLVARPADDPDAGLRVDLTAQSVVTIDDESTREVDDGLAVEALEGGGVRLWVHVADPTRWLPSPDHPLCREAQERTRTLYLPTGAVTMFPSSLATGPFSLREDEECSALSIGVEVDEAGALRLDCATIQPSRIRVRHRLSYLEADAILQGTAPHPWRSNLTVLNEVAQLRQRWRFAGGALSVQLTEAQIHVTSSDCLEPIISIEPLNQDESPSRKLVAEMMILANEAVGAFGAREGIPLPYRGQAAAVLPVEQEMEGVPPGLCTMALLRSRMTRGQLNTAGPLHHAGLGLPTYVQFTSPIRRFTDMLAHWQIKAHLRGEHLPFNAEELSVVVDECNATSREHLLVERKVENYWLAMFFKQCQANGRSTWPVMLLQWVRQESGFAKILIGELGLELAMHISQPLQLGDRFQVEVSSIDVADGSFSLVDVSPALRSGRMEGYNGADSDEQTEERMADDALDAAAALEPRLLTEQVI